MTPADMARIHAAAFIHDRGWQAQEFEALLLSPHITAFTEPEAFALTRTLAGESELITLAVHPAHRRRGLARGLLDRWLSASSGPAQTAFLEVASDNDAAIALYQSVGFEQSGLRRAYYVRKPAPAVDAVLMTKTLTQGQ